MGNLHVLWALKLDGYREDAYALKLGIAFKYLAESRPVGIVLSTPKAGILRFVFRSKDP